MPNDHLSTILLTNPTLTSKWYAWISTAWCWIWHRMKGGSWCLNTGTFQERTTLFWVITQWVVVISYQHFRSTYQSHPQCSRIQNHACDFLAKWDNPNKKILVLQVVGWAYSQLDHPIKKKILAMKSQVGTVGWIIGNAEYSKCQPIDFEQRICKSNKW